MENNWPETVDELLDECQRLTSRYDLYTLGERGEPFAGEDEPRVDGTEYLAGEYRYGVAMIPAQWVRHVLSSAELGSEREKQLESFVLDMLFAIKIGSMSDLADRSVLKSWLKDFSERASELGLLEGDDDER